MPNVRKSYDIPIKTRKKRSRSEQFGQFSADSYKEAPFVEYGIQSSRLSSSRQTRQALPGGVVNGEPCFERHGDFFL